MHTGTLALRFDSWGQIFAVVQFLLHTVNLLWVFISTCIKIPINAFRFSLNSVGSCISFISAEQWDSIIKANVALSAISLPPSKLLIVFNCYLKQHLILPPKYYMNFRHKTKMCKLMPVRHGRTGRRSSFVGLPSVQCHQDSFTQTTTRVELHSTDPFQVLSGHLILVLPFVNVYLSIRERRKKEKEGI